MTWDLPKPTERLKNHSMGPLKNSKHEAFARGIFEGKTGREAYFAAGYNCTPAAADASACDLLKTPKVAARVTELKDRLAAKVVLSKVIVENVHRLAGVAETKDQLSVARGCWELLGREYGAFTETKRVSIRAFSDMTAEEIEAFLAGQSAAPPEKKARRGRKG